MPASRSATLRTPKPTVAASNGAVRERKGEQVALHPGHGVRLAARPLEHRRREVEPGDDPALSLGGDREVAGAAAGVEHPEAGLDDLLDGEPPPRTVEPGGHHAVHGVVDRCDPVEHRRDLARREGSGLVGHSPHLPDEGGRDPELVEAACDDEVDEILDRRGTVVEARRGEEDHGARLVERREAAEVDRRERRLARDEHELAPLLERDRGRTVDQVRHRAGGERADGGHRARADDVGVDLCRPARVRALPVVDRVDRDAVAASPTNRPSTSSRASEASR